MRRLIGIFLMCSTFVTASAGAMPLRQLLETEYSGLYNVFADGFKVGEMKLTHRQQTEHTFVTVTEMYTTGLVALFKKDRHVERSVSRLQSGVIKPLLYSSQYAGRSEPSLEQLDFDWRQGVATGVFNERPVRLPIDDAVVYDKQSYQLALRHDLSAGARRVDYLVIDQDRFQDYRFRVVAEETLDTEIGPLRTLKVERFYESGDSGLKRPTYFWCAVDLDYVLVKIVQHNGDHTVSSEIISLDRDLSATAAVR